jgi:5-oxoprolinase (ATP-hydrolysing) subunit C
MAQTIKHTTTKPVSVADNSSSKASSAPFVTLVVDEVGPATSVQDAGRFGGQRYGLGAAGAMDQGALAAVQALVGSASSAGAVEVGPFAAKFTARGGDLRVAVSGAIRPIKIGDRSVAMLSTVRLQDGKTLSLGFAKGGVFSYLAIEGGIQAAPVMGSLSVHLRAGLGSPYARPLKVGDTLSVRPASANVERMLLSANPTHGPIRVVLGPQDDYFSPEIISQFLATVWRVSATSDRMGYRLEGPALAHAKGYNIVSDGIANGSIQIPGNGQPLVLLADRGTTGGYPKIATIVSADLGRCAQIGVGQALQFAAVTIETAQTIARTWMAELAALPSRVQEVRDASVIEARLFDANVAGAAVHATDWQSWSGP